MFISKVISKQSYHIFLSWLVQIFLFILPFNAVLVTFTQYRLGIGGFTFVKEALLIAIFGLSLIRNYKSIFRKKVFENKLMLLIFAYLGWMIFSLSYADGDLISRLIYGFKYDGFYILCLLTGLIIPSEVVKDWSKFLKSAFLGLASATGIGLFLHFIVGPQNLTWLGYRPDWSTFYIDQALAFCQKIENSPICRFQGTFSGPNQAGANLLLMITLGFGLLPINIKKDHKTVFAILFGFIAVYSTFSRSSWLALIALIGLILCFKHRNLLKKYILSIISSIVVIIGATLWLIPEVIFRLGSNSERLNLLARGFTIMTDQLWIGLGLASSGPASRLAGNNIIITENWFLQVGINFGLIGLGLFLALYFYTAKKLYSSKNYSAQILALLFIALIIPLNLLHYFEDSSFSYSLFLIAGILINLQQSTFQNTHTETAINSEDQKV